MRHLESMLCHIEEVLNAKIIFIYVMYSSSKLRLFSFENYLGTTLIIGNLMINRVTSVEWKWLGLEWPPVQYVALYIGDIVS
jgi:hypothetical protein